MSYVLPALILLLTVYALIRGVDVYDAFVTGALEALPLLYKVLPYMATMLLAMKLLRGSGALDAALRFIAPPLAAVGYPAELVPMTLLRPFSGSAALSLLDDVFTAYGTDSYIGIAASLMLGSTETIFYTIALYYGSVGISRTRHSVPAALIAGASGAIASVLLARLMV